MTRQERLVRLIRALPEAIGGGGSVDFDVAAGGRDSKLLTYGPLCHATCPRNCHRDDRCRSPFRELQRCLALLDHVERKHVLARYLQGTWTQRPVKHFEERRYGKVIALHPAQLPLCSEIAATGGAQQGHALLISCIVHTWPTWVSNELVDEALANLERCYQGSIDLPQELLRGIAA